VQPIPARVHEEAQEKNKSQKAYVQYVVARMICRVFTNALIAQAEGQQEILKTEQEEGY